MNAGELRRRIVIEAPTVSQSSTTGEATQTWATHATVWAGVKPVPASKASEALLAGQTTVSNEVIISIRYLATLAATMRISCDGHTYGILAIEDVAALHQQQRMVCAEVV